MLNKPCYCDICNNSKDYKLAGKLTHIKSKKHIKNFEKHIEYFFV